MAHATEENLTDLVVGRWSEAPDPRLRALVTALVRHAHAFVREVEPTREEFLAAVDFLARTGQACTGNRQEFILLSDVLGLSMLVDSINNRGSSGATPSTIEGPFHVAGSPQLGPGDSMAGDAPGRPCFLSGTVRSTDGTPIAGATLDIWQSDGDGLYEAQREGIDGPWMRGSYRSGADGSYAVRTVLPIAYSIPMDGPVGGLVGAAGISHMRPAHIHFALSAGGYRPIVTHLFQRGDRYIDSDAVFAVKEPLIVAFEERPAGTAPTGEVLDRPYYAVACDFVLEPAPATAGG